MGGLTMFAIETLIVAILSFAAWALANLVLALL